MSRQTANHRNLSQTPSQISAAGLSRKMSGMPGTGFIRVKLLQVDLAETTDESFLAVNVKEMVDIPGKGQQLVQKKRTLYPKWNSCFDAHLYQGRTIQVIVMERPNRNLADINVSAQALADKCEKSTGGTSGPIWVSPCPKGQC
ncbi:protein kinase c [Plakobranchus ocellatus]|uniref:Protein kinase c n=1 Tax=Plakobranchus ocellatus TaxID=259542 RepID=A0AAV4DER4_9GAST|nr:protein kinase c [Plakobranchus ocellatus]